MTFLLTGPVTTTHKSQTRSEESALINICVCDFLESNTGFRYGGLGVGDHALLGEAPHQLQEAVRTVFEIEVLLKTPAAVRSHGGAFGIIKPAPGQEKVDGAREGILFHKAGVFVPYLAPDIHLGGDQRGHTTREGFGHDDSEVLLV